MASTLVALMVIFSISCVNSNICYKIVNGKTEKFCCDNSEPKGEECIECLDGYTSKDAEPCKPCPEGSFGRKCSGSCTSCAKNQSCSFILGCVELRQTQELSSGSTEKGRGFSSTTHTVIASTMPSEMCKTTKEFVVREILLASVTALSVTVFVVFCLYRLCLARCRACVSKKRTNKNGQIEVDSSHYYDYADENTMMNHIESSRFENVRREERSVEMGIPNFVVSLPRETSLNGGYIEPVTSSLNGGYLEPVSSSLNGGYLEPVSSTIV